MYARYGILSKLSDFDTKTLKNQYVYIFTIKLIIRLFSRKFVNILLALQ